MDTTSANPATATWTLRFMRLMALANMAALGVLTTTALLILHPSRPWLFPTLFGAMPLLLGLAGQALGWHLERRQLARLATLPATEDGETDVARVLRSTQVVRTAMTEGGGVLGFTFAFVQAPAAGAFATLLLGAVPALVGLAFLYPTRAGMSRRLSRLLAHGRGQAYVRPREAGAVRRLG